VSAPVPVLALVLLAAALCAGCGAADRAPDAAAVVHRFEEALNSRDGKAACALLNQQTAAKLAQQDGRPCEQAILAARLPAGRAVKHTSVYVTSASVSLADGGALFLDEAPRGWEISAAGCRPTGPDQPFDCDLED
jgi:hypothetical protein